MNPLPDSAALDAALAAMAGALRADPRPDTVLIGIHTGGVWVAQRLARALGWPPPATLDASFYRDDYARSGLPARVQPSDLSSLEGRHAVLVDDVIGTGRTVRAALSQLFDYGRPATVRLVVLVDRGGRELPIAPDIVGLRLTVAPRVHLKLSGPEPLTLVAEAAPP